MTLKTILVVDDEKIVRDFFIDVARSLGGNVETAEDGDVAVEVAVDRVVLEHVGQVVGVQKIVDADDLDIREVFGDSAERHAADATETVDAYFNRHDFLLIFAG